LTIVLSFFWPLHCAYLPNTNRTSSSPHKKWSVFSPWYRWKFVHLALNSKHPLTWLPSVRQYFQVYS
jgi:hypothetical protein